MMVRVPLINQKFHLILHRFHFNTIFVNTHPLHQICAQSSLISFQSSFPFFKFVSEFIELDEFNENVH